MSRKVLLAGVAFIVLGAANSFATSVALTLSVNTTLSTWTVSGLASGGDTMGLADFTVDVNGNGVSIIKAATVSATNQTPSAVFSQLRTTGTVSGANLTGIAGSEDAIDAIQNNDDSGASGGTALVYGYSFTGSAASQYTSNDYGSPGTVTGLGAITLAMGRYTGSPVAGVSSITAQVTTGDKFQFFPLNWDPNNDPTQGSALVTNSTAVTPSTFTFPVPEPASLLLMGLGGIGLAAFARRRRRAA